jgi:glycosyltransferase involved in cell wall biosynthesis
LDLDVKGRFVLVVVAHLIKPKGVDVAIRAMVELPDDVVLLVIGTGGELEPLRDLCKQLSLEARVRMLGLQWDIAPYLHAADCLICPSIWAEAAGYAILEGLACGLPVLASAVGGIPELIADGKTGFLVPAGDSQALSARIRDLYNAPEACRKIGMEARAAAVRDFSLERRIVENLRVYRA